MPDGTHLVAAKVGVVLRADGTVIDTIAATFEGVALQDPNDLALDGNGGFNFTDPAAADPAAAARLGRIDHVDAQHAPGLSATDF